MKANMVSKMSWLMFAKKWIDKSHVTLKLSELTDPEEEEEGAAVTKLRRGNVNGF